jgi:hypothetical protein
LKTTQDKSGQYEKQSSDISLVLGELTTGVDNVISILQRIAKQRPLSGEQAVIASTENEDNEEPRPTTGNSNGVAKRAEKVRAMIDFNIPSDTLGPTGVSEANLIQYLGLIEHKANELLTLNFLVNSPKKAVQLTGDQDGSGLATIGGVGGLLGQGPTAQIGNITIIPPSTAYFKFNLATNMILVIMPQMKTIDH